MYMMSVSVFMKFLLNKNTGLQSFNYDKLKNTESTVTK